MTSLPFPKQNISSLPVALDHKDNTAFQTTLTTLCNTNRAFTALEAAYFYMNTLTKMKPSPALPDPPACLHRIKLIITAILTCSFPNNQQTEPNLWTGLQEFTSDLITVASQTDTSGNIISPALTRVLQLANKVHAESEDTVVFPHVVHFAFFCFRTAFSVENYPLLPTAPVP